MTSLAMLPTYAQRIDPSTLPPTIKLCHSDFSVTIFDKFPKAHFHFLLLPLVRPPLRVQDLRDLSSLLRLPREQAKAILQNIRRDALVAKALVEEEMVRKHGFKWDVQLGFHAVPSVEYVPISFKHLQHLHLHIISTEFRGMYMKSKKHINSYHPSLGFFLHIDDILSWFEPDVAPTWFAMKSDINKKEYLMLLREDLTCPGHCDLAFKATSKLTDHLRSNWDKMVKAHKAKTTPAAVDSASADVAPDTAQTGTKRTADQVEDAAEEADASEAQPSKRHCPNGSADQAQDA